MYKPPVRHILRASRVFGPTSYNRAETREALRRAVDEMFEDDVEDMLELAHYFELEQDWREG